MTNRSFHKQDELSSELIHAAVEHYEQKVLHWQGGRLYTQDYFQLLDYRLLATGSLREGLNSWVDGIYCLQPRLQPVLTQTDREIILSFRGAASLPMWLKIMLYQMHVRLTQWFCYDERPPLWFMELSDTEFGYVPPHDAVRLPIYLGHAHNQFCIPNHLLDARYPYSYPVIAHSLNLLMRRLRPDTMVKQDWLSNVKHWLNDALPDPLSLQELGENLGVSARTLQRKLKSNASSYQQLIDEVRYERAIRLLANPRLSLKEIAMQLGFAEQSSFQRAFRGWHGCSPGEYRQRIRSTAENRMNDWPEIMLYLASNHNQTGNDFSRRGNQVWVLVKNLSFEKEVAIVSQDLDGVWRRYAATFERFYCAGWELWSSSNLPVSEPFQFYLEYRADGMVYTDDNWKQNYKLESANHAIIGQIDLVSQALGLIPTDDGFLFIGYVYSSIDDAQQVKLELVFENGSRTWRAANKLWTNAQGVSAWRYTLRLTRPIHSYRIVLETTRASFFEAFIEQAAVPERWL